MNFSTVERELKKGRSHAKDEDKIQCQEAFQAYRYRQDQEKARF
jgi:hypothetical protein